MSGLSDDPYDLYPQQPTVVNSRFALNRPSPHIEEEEEEEHHHKQQEEIIIELRSVEAEERLRLLEDLNHLLRDRGWKKVIKKIKVEKTMVEDEAYCYFTLVVHRELPNFKYVERVEEFKYAFKMMNASVEPTFSAKNIADLLLEEQ